ncbi:alpha/beta hydrolase [Actinoplanes sp. NPDC051470]|uniref:alpha/beta fold hydrolase n=1 Tax=Actinoplanes sp. NPDC051470 TaxID=3157224 RepID=UPI003443FD56
MHHFEDSLGPVGEAEAGQPEPGKLKVADLDCGHGIQQEKPEETNQAILTWLNRHWSQRTGSDFPAGSKRADTWWCRG